MMLNRSLDYLLQPVLAAVLGCVLRQRAICEDIRNRW